MLKDKSQNHVRNWIKIVIKYIFIIYNWEEVKLNWIREYDKKLATTVNN